MEQYRVLAESCVYLRLPRAPGLHTARHPLGGYPAHRIHPTQSKRHSWSADLLHTLPPKRTENKYMYGSKLAFIFSKGVNLHWPHKLNCNSAVSDSNKKWFSMNLNACQCMASLMICIIAHAYFSSFKFPFYSESPSNSQATAVYKKKLCLFKS